MLVLVGALLVSAHPLRLRAPSFPGPWPDLFIIVLGHTEAKLSEDMLTFAAYASKLSANNRKLHVAKVMHLKNQNVQGTMTPHHVGPGDNDAQSVCLNHTTFRCTNLCRNDPHGETVKGLSLLAWASVIVTTRHQLRDGVDETQLKVRRGGNQQVRCPSARGPVMRLLDA